MTRALLVAALLTASMTTVAAESLGVGGYVGLGIGPAASVSYENARSVEPNGRSGHLFAGLRLKSTPLISRFSLELSAVFDSFVVNQGNAYDARMIGLAARYSHPLGGGMDVYAKLGGAQTTFDTSSQYDAEGAQVLLGIGAEYRLPTKLALSVLVDYTRYQGSLDLASIGPIDAGLGVWKLGATIGF